MIEDCDDEFEVAVNGRISGGSESSATEDFLSSRCCCCCGGGGVDGTKKPSLSRARVLKVCGGGEEIDSDLSGD